jgi:hypothetical protein
MKRMSREVERREPERAAGLLGERWMREPSNSPSVSEVSDSACAADKRKTLNPRRECASTKQAGLLGERWMREPSNGPSAAR